MLCSPDCSQCLNYVAIPSQYLHAALGFTTRSAIVSGKQAEKIAAKNAANGIKQEFTPLFSLATVRSIWRWIGCSSLCFVASIWIFSGYYGQ